MATHLTLGERERIVVELSSGKKQREVAKECGLSLSVVAGVWREHREADAASNGAITKRLNAKIKQRMVELEIGLKRGDVNSERAVEDAVELAALDRSRVVLRHKAEWDAHRPLVEDAIKAAQPGFAEDGGRDIKMAYQLAGVAEKTAKTIQTRQEAERKLYGLDVGEEGDPRPYAEASDASLKEMLAMEIDRLKAEGLINESDLEQMLPGRAH